MRGRAGLKPHSNVVLFSNTPTLHINIFARLSPHPNPLPGGEREPKRDGDASTQPALLPLPFGERAGVRGRASLKRHGNGEMFSNSSRDAAVYNGIPFKGGMRMQHHDDLSAHDLAALQGTWEQVAHEADGITNPPDEYGALGAITTFSGQHFAVHARDGELLLEGNFTLDATTTPKSITWTDAIGADAGKQLPASYVLDGDHFVFIAADEGCSRPYEFRTVPGLTMRRFIRSR